MDCLIHVGMHKTGSSSIQNALANYDDGKNAYAQLGGANHSAQIFTAFSDEYLTYHTWNKKGLSEREINDMRLDFVARLESQLTRDLPGQLIISGEDISYLGDENAGQFIEFLKPYCSAIRVISYVRNPLEYAMSAFQQSVKGGGLRSISGRIYPGYKERMSVFLDVMGKENLTVREFSKEKLVGGDVVADFCAVAGLDATRVDSVRDNESMSVDALKYLFLFNASNPLYFGDAYVTQKRARMVRFVMKLFEASEKIDKHYFRSVADFSGCEWLKENFSIDFCPQGDEAENAGDPVDLEHWLYDVSPQSMEVLVSVLMEHGVNPGYKTDPVRLVNRLFYLFLQNKIR